MDDFSLFQFQDLKRVTLAETNVETPADMTLRGMSTAIGGSGLALDSNLLF